ncbi:MAG: hypothetical protein KF696_11855 [Planctomycetes bacterium]|nr:hypothetical protein [Planctomycetota bacterium]MCW8136982.1 hypothetical protein [Planctomycetota bacterium]
MLSSLPRLAALLVLAGLLASCSNIETPDLKADVEREKIIPSDWQPLPLRVGLAPFRMALEIDDKRSNVENTKRWVLVPDDERLNGPEGLHRQMLDVLRQYRMFQSVEAIEGATADTSRADLQAAALKQGLDIIIVPTLKRHDIGYVDSNGAYGWNMFIWWMVSPIFSWFIADEDFDAHLHVDLKLYPTNRDEELAGKRLQPPDTIIRSLDDFDEGFNLFSIYSTPSHFDESNWQKIGGKLMPIAENEAYKAALRYVTTELKPLSETERFRAGIRRRLALVIGVDGAGQAGVPLTRFAARDAQEFAAQAVEAANDAVPEGALRAAVGPRATRRAVEQAARDIATLARGNDDVILYFSGVGSMDDKGELHLVLAQPAGAAPERMPLNALLDLLLANRPRTLTLVLDCSFNAPADKRCATTPEALAAVRANGAKGCRLDDVIARARARGTAVNLLASSSAEVDGAPMPALEIDDLAHGLFSSFALQGLGGEADANRDRQVTIEELKSYLELKVTHIAQLEGEGQTGWYRIDEARRGYTLPGLRR